jgi:hypothetical protein
LIRDLIGGFPSGPAAGIYAAQVGRTYESNRSHIPTKRLAKGGVHI